MTLITSYYSNDDNQLEIRELMKSLERQVAIVQARLVKKEYKSLKASFKADGIDIATSTKLALQTIGNQLDTGIKGEVRKSLKKTLDEQLPKYDTIF